MCARSIIDNIGGLTNTMVYIGYCTDSDVYVFAKENAMLGDRSTIEVKATCLSQAIERARQHFFGMA